MCLIGFCLTHEHFPIAFIFLHQLFMTAHADQLAVFDVNNPRCTDSSCQTVGDDNHHLILVFIQNLLIQCCLCKRVKRAVGFVGNHLTNFNLCDII